MGIPGFAGDAAVYRSSRGYWGNRRRVPLRGERLVPQLESFCQMECRVECEHYNDCHTSLDPAACMDRCIGDCVDICEGMVPG